MKICRKLAFLQRNDQIDTGSRHKDSPFIRTVNNIVVALLLINLYCRYMYNMLYSTFGGGALFSRVSRPQIFHKIIVETHTDL